MELEANAFISAVNRLEPRFRAHKYDRVPRTVEELLEIGLEQSPLAAFVTLLALREMRPTLAKVRAQDIHVHHKRGKPSFTLFAGDLEIKGNFAYEHTVLVLGDLIVDGLVEDRFEGSSLLVAGSVRAKGMYLGSETRIGGALDLSELLHLRGGGKVCVERGGRTRLFVWTPQDSKYAGKLDAMHALRAYPEQSDPDLVKLRGLLSPYLARKLDADEPDLTLLARAVRDGTPLWRA